MDLEMEEKSDDDLTDLFDQVANKLGWKSDVDLDLNSVLNQLTQSTKKKKKKGNKPWRKKTGKPSAKNQSNSETHHSVGTPGNSTLLSNDKSKNVRQETNATLDQGVNHEKISLGGLECSPVMTNNEGKVNGMPPNSTHTSYSIAIAKAEGPSTVVSSNLTTDVNIKLNDGEQNSPHKPETFIQNPNHSDDDDTDIYPADSRNCESPLPHCIEFDYSREHVATDDVESNTRSPQCSHSESEECDQKANSLGRNHKVTAHMSESFTDSPEPMHWLMSPAQKAKPAERHPHPCTSSDDDDDDEEDDRKDNGDVAHCDEEDEKDNVVDIEAETRVLSLTERLAQNHQKSLQKDASQTRRQRRRSCANPRSKPLVLDNEWAGNDDGVENEDGDSINVRSDKQEVQDENRDKERTTSQKGSVSASTTSFQKARIKGVDSSSDDDFESFLNAIKTPKHARGRPEDSDSDEVVVVLDDDDFIDDTPLKSNSDGDDDDSDDVFYLKMINSDNPLTSSRKNGSKRPTVGSRSGSILSSVYPISDDDDEDVFVTPRSMPSFKKTKPKVSTSTTSKTTTSSKKTPSAKPPRRPLQTKSLSSNPPGYGTPSRAEQPARPASFLGSLSTPGKGMSTRSRYVSDFKRNKDELTQRLFKLYNETVFEDKLPADFSITWNVRMRKTAGFCFYKKRLGERTARIELSVKVCDSAERLRDTLIHELCHAAAWLIHGVSDGHGKFWKYWAAKSNLAHPEIPVIKRCHTYEIHTKFKYKCVQCGNIIGRHSKSVDTTRFCCAYCAGKLELLPPLNKDGTPARARGPNPFAAFVKQNYASTKKTHGAAIKHADVMRLLSQEFSSKAKITDS